MTNNLVRPWQIYGYEDFKSSSQNNLIYIVDQNLFGGKSQDYLNYIYASGSALNIDVIAYKNAWIDLDQNCTITIINWPATRILSTCTLIINPNTYTVSWGSTIIWMDGSAPSFTSNTTSIIKLWTPNGGATIYGQELIINSTEVNLPPQGLLGYIFGGAAGQRTAFNMTLDVQITLSNNESPLSNAGGSGTVSDLVQYAYWHEGCVTLTNNARKMDLFTQVRTWMNVPYTFYDYTGSSIPNAIANGSTNSYAYIPQGARYYVNSDVGGNATGWTLDFGNLTHALKYLSYDHRSCIGMSGATYGYFFSTSVSAHNKNCATKITYTSGVSSYFASKGTAAYGPKVSFNNQSTASYYYGGYTGSGYTTLGYKVTYSGDTWATLTAMDAIDSSWAYGAGSFVNSALAGYELTYLQYYDRKFTFSSETKTTNIAGLLRDESSQTFCFSDFTRC